jgi:uncharacterized phage-associated protein
MANAKDVAEYFLLKSKEEDCGISNLKLQKLIYYAQAFHLAIFEKPLFNEEIEAWTHGPVCPAIYHEYKRFGSNIIDLESQPNLNVFTPEQVELLDEVNDVFGQFSAWKLRNMTHEDEPWKLNESTASIIEKPLMMEFYKKRIR